MLKDYFITGEISRLKEITWEKEWIFEMIKEFYEDSPMHSKTMSSHSCYLFNKNGLLFACEDLGRHNALDKAVGFAVRNNFELSECMLFTSGRMPVDMVAKVIRAGVPVLAGKSSPTAEAVMLAEEYGLVLIGNAYREGYCKYGEL